MILQHKKDIEVLAFIQQGFYSVTEIAQEKHLPRSSVQRILERLYEHRLVVKKEMPPRAVLWKGKGEESLKKEIEKVEAILFGREYIENKAPSVCVREYNGVVAIVTAIEKLFISNPHKRIYALQGKTSREELRRVFGIDAVAALETRLKAQGVILVGLRENGVDLRDFVGKKESFLGRITDTRIASGQLFEPHVSLYFSDTTLLCLDTEKVCLLEIENKRFVASFKRLFVPIHQMSEKVDIHKYTR